MDGLTERRRLLFVLILACLGGLVYFFPGPATTIDLGYIPPSGSVDKLLETATKEQQEILRNWRDPGSWACAHFAQPGACESACQLLEKRSEPAAILAIDALYQAAEGKGLPCQNSALDRVCLSIPSQEPATRELVGKALLAVLERQAEKELQIVETHTGVAQDLHQAEERLQAEEAKLRLLTTSLPDRGSLSIESNFALSHYQVALNRWRQARQENERWRHGIAGLRPRFVLLTSSGRIP